jgi:hypothetical protein
MSERTGLVERNRKPVCNKTAGKMMISGGIPQFGEQQRISSPPDKA